MNRAQNVFTPRAIFFLLISQIALFSPQTWPHNVVVDGRDKVHDAETAGNQTAVSVKDEEKEEFPKGEIIDRVVCRDDPEQSYALYLPPAYSEDKRWPVLYAQDPGGVGSRPLNFFLPAAEKYQYILIGLNNSRNGPWEPILKAIQMVWLDTRLRFSFDEKRIYTTGFSGGARAASAFPLEIQHDIAGTIACGAGLPTWMKPDQVKASFFYGIVGLLDFNYRELAELDETFDRLGPDHRIEVIEGGHRWPPEAVCTRAVEWLEIHAMKTGLREKDPELIDMIHENLAKRAAGLADQGQVYYAAGMYESIGVLFENLKDPGAVLEKAERLKKGKAFQQFQKDQTARNKKEQKMIADFQSVFERIESPGSADLTLKKIRADLHIEDLLKVSKSEDRIHDRAWADRLLGDLAIHADEKGLSCLQRRDARGAVMFYEIAAGVRQADPRLFYNLACAYAVNQNKEKAIRNLKLAIEKGFRNRALIEKDEDLNNIRQEPAYRDIINDLK